MFPLPLVIDTTASAALKSLLVAVHLAALAALLLTSLPGAVRLTGALLLGGSLWATWNRLVSVRLRARADGQLEIWRDAAWKQVQLRSDSVALPWLIVLRWREGRRRHSLALPGDALAGDEHRRLRVWLRWKATRL